MKFSRKVLKNKRVLLIVLMAIVVLSCFYGVTRLFESHFILRPQVVVSGTYFYGTGQAGALPRLPEDAVYLGDIQSVVPSHERPTKDMQTNASALKGAQVYQCGENILVRGESDTVWWTFSQTMK